MKSLSLPSKDTFRYAVQLQFPATNNESEYKTILKGLRMTKTMGTKNLLSKSDSKLVIGRIKGNYEVKEQRMQRYLKLTNLLVGKLE